MEGDSCKGLPTQMRQMMVTKLGNTNYREVTEIVSVPVPVPGPKQALVRNSYVGINACDILYSDAHFTPGTVPPFPAGLEGIGEVVCAGEESKLNVGQHVFYVKEGSFGEYMVLDESDNMFPIPSGDPANFPIYLSGTTASLALEKKANLKKGEIVLVTAAAGATGMFAVQLAKLAGCHVIGTCSSEEKVDFLKSIGCDRPINYTKESLDDVLKKEYPNGLDVVYESVGNEIFDTCFNNLNFCGRIIVLGAISSYDKEGHIKKATTSLAFPCNTLLKSTEIRGFSLFCFMKEAPAHAQTLLDLKASGKLKAPADNGEQSEKGPFIGLEKVYDALDHMYSKRNVGKVVVAIDQKAK